MAWLPPRMLTQNLNPAQQQAVTHPPGPLVVFAGAGSGKTRVITHRIAHLIHSERVRPWQILAVTFTNKAAAEMQHRIAQLLRRDADNLWIGTFHAICAKLLRLYAPHTGVAPNFVIYDETDQRALIARLLRDLELDERRYAPKQVAAHINRAKQEMRGPEELETYDYYTDTIQKIYLAYEENLRRARALDFGDLIYRCTLALETNPKFQSEIESRFQHVLVDEFQDTNHAQFRMIRAIACNHRNICVVGDDDQSIYRWRGADRRNILDFGQTFEDARVVKLEQNYRSTQRILRAADAVICRCLDREPKTLWTENEEGSHLRLVRCFDERDEGQTVLRAIRELEAEGFALSDIAIFYRIHAQSRVLEETLRAANLPYQIIGGVRFYERAEIKDVLAYLRVLANPDDDVSLLRIINVPARGIGKTTLQRLLSFCQEQHCSVWQALAAADSIPNIGSAYKKLSGFYELLAQLRRLLESETSPVRIAEEVLERTGYVAQLQAQDSAEADARLQNVQEFVGSVMDYERDASEPSLQAFLELVTLQTSQDTASSQSKLTLMTVHAAKGLEYPVVIVTGMEEGMFPFKGIQPGDDPEELEEERRLAYVAFTRAKQHLLLSYAGQRRVFGQLRVGMVSRFADEIPAEDVQHIGAPESRWQPRHSASSWSADPYEGFSGDSYVEREGGDAFYDADDYKGMLVQHAKFGVGKVIQMTPGSPPKMTVVFPGWGQKNIAANFLQPVS